MPNEQQNVRSYDGPQDAGTSARADIVEQRVVQHYSRTGLDEIIIKALVASGKDPGRVARSDLSPVDEFHSAGQQATVEFAEQVNFASGMHILDVGCGIGGPSRFFAAARNCRVTGIDLTVDYVETARSLARLVGLDDRVSYRRASALAMPFEAGTFDGAYMMHVGMNIEDKPTLFVEIRRVLKSGAQFAVFDIMRTGTGDLHYPLHWAATSETSFVVGAAQYRDALQAAGFEIIRERDRGDFARAFFREVTARADKQSEPPPLGIHILMKDNVPQKLANVVSGLEDGVIAPTEIVARAC